jgi:hypothetical protein
VLTRRRPAVRRQMVWKGTTQVGCGRTPNCAISGFGPGTMYSCRYSPPGAQPSCSQAGTLERHSVWQGMHVSYEAARPCCGARTGSCSVVLSGRHRGCCNSVYVLCPARVGLRTADLAAAVAAGNYVGATNFQNNVLQPAATGRR